MKRLIAAVVSVVSLSVLVPIPALAGAPQAPSWKSVSPDLIARGEARQALALEWYAAVFGKGSVAKYQRDLAAFTRKWGKDRFNASDSLASSTAALSSPPSSLALLMNQYPEQSPSQYCRLGVPTCYCGPSTAESVLQYLQPVSYNFPTYGRFTLIPNGNWQSGQYGLAGTFGPGSPNSRWFLETNYWGGETPWYVSNNDLPMAGSFNYWSSGNVSGYPGYINVPHPTVAQYEADLVSDIWGGGPANSNGYPLAADTEELPNNTHLFGHPTNLEIQHWIALYGYSTSGQFTDYIDPVYGSALNNTNGFSVSAKNTTYPSSDMQTLVSDASQHFGPYGIVF